MKPTYVYFIKPIGMEGPIKIGCSDTPKNRLECLSAWSPFRLEVIGAVPGGFKDEKFLHECFLDEYSHREWFRASPALIGTIAKILVANSIDAVRGEIAPKGKIPKLPRKKKSDSELERRHFGRRISFTVKKLRNLEEHSAWATPDDIESIMRLWGKGTRPSEAGFARIEEYLADPAPHSVIPSWRQRKNSICIPVFVDDATLDETPALSAQPPASVRAGNLSQVQS